MLEAVEGKLRLLEVLGLMRCVLLYVLKAMEGVRYVLESRWRLWKAYTDSIMAGMRASGFRNFIVAVFSLQSAIRCIEDNV